MSHSRLTDKPGIRKCAAGFVITAHYVHKLTLTLLPMG